MKIKTIVDSIAAGFFTVGIAWTGVGALPGACLGAAWGSAASAIWEHFGW